MEKTKVVREDGSWYQTNSMLDDVIETVQEKYGINNDELIKELTIQKIEYARHCMAQMLVQGGQTLQTMTNSFNKLDNGIALKIIEVGGKPKSSLDTDSLIAGNCIIGRKQ